MFNRKLCWPNALESESNVMSHIGVTWKFQATSYVGIL